MIEHARYPDLLKVPHILHSPLGERTFLKAHRPFLGNMGAILVQQLAETDAAKSIAHYAHLFDPATNDLNASLITMARAEYVLREQYVPVHDTKPMAVRAYNDALIRAVITRNKDQPTVSIQLAKPAIQVLSSRFGDRPDKYAVHVPLIAKDLEDDHRILQDVFDIDTGQIVDIKPYHSHITLGLMYDLESAQQLSDAVEQAGIPDAAPLALGQLTLVGGSRPRSHVAVGAVQPMY